MTRKSRELGEKGEQIAADYLSRKGYHIIERNWIFDHKELDIIAWEGDELVFVEVKTRTGYQYEHPLEAISTGKIRNLVIAADRYIRMRDLDVESRFDVITVVFYGDKFELQHYPGAFIPPVN
jgi:putative endonuclease